jgi:hypothetical protein
MQKECAEEHCQFGAMSRFHQRIFDWLDEAIDTYPCSALRDSNPPLRVN